MTAPDTLPVLVTRRQLDALVAPYGLTADGARSIPEIAAAELRLSPRRPRWRRAAIMRVLAGLEGAT